MSVYAVVDGPDVKIGVTVDIPRRMRELQTGNPRPLICYKTLKTAHSHKYESLIHDFLEPYDARKVYGVSSAREWFHVGRSKLVVDRLFDVIYHSAEAGHAPGDITTVLNRLHDWIMGRASGDFDDMMMTVLRNMPRLAMVMLTVTTTTKVEIVAGPPSTAVKKLEKQLAKAKISEKKA